jgi:vitamin B12 transporter
VRDLSFEANYTFTERKGDPGIRIPKHKAFANLGYQVTDRFYASASYAYTGARVDTDFNTFNQVGLEPFGLVGMYMKYTLIPQRLTVFLQGDNLLNAEFTEIVGFNTRGRNIRMGFDLKL